jgi:hypothetical protein
MAPNDLSFLEIEEEGDETFLDAEEEEDPCFTNVYDRDWINDDDDDSICLEYSDDNDECHELYLQRDGLEFRMPIVFEDGMDFEESQLYYASIESQLTGGALRCLQKKQRRRSTTRDITGPVNSISLPSCLRKPRIAKSQPREPTAQRRISFGGNSKYGDVQQTLVKSHSMRGLGDNEAHRLCFEEYVHVNTIPSVDDYPPAIRSQLWMSREEMMTAMRRAMAEDVREPQREEEEHDYATHEKHKGDDVVRQNSMNSIITECIQTVEVGIQ